MSRIVFAVNTQYLLLYQQTLMEKNKNEMNARAKHAILCGLTKYVFVKIMHCKYAREIWEKLENIYQGNEKVK